MRPLQLISLPVLSYLHVQASPVRNPNMQSHNTNSLRFTHQERIKGVCTPERVEMPVSEVACDKWIVVVRGGMFRFFVRLAVGNGLDFPLSQYYSCI
jgi:hypothetical protein